MSFYPFFPGGAQSLLGTTGAAGFALQNSTPAILTWTAPNDGLLHLVKVYATLNTTAAETGGQVNLGYTEVFGGAATSGLIFGAGAAIGVQHTTIYRLVQAGTAVTVTQTALTAGAAVLYAEMWGA